MIAMIFFPFLISNLLKIETTANSFLLNLSFSVGGEGGEALAKNIHSYSEFKLSTRVVSFSKRHFASRFTGLLSDMSVMKLDTTDH